MLSFLQDYLNGKHKLGLLLANPGSEVLTTQQSNEEACRASGILLRAKSFCHGFSQRAL